MTTQFQTTTLEQKIVIAKQVYDGVMMLGMVTAAFEAAAKIKELEDMLKSDTSSADKIAELETQREKLFTRYERKVKKIADLKREYYVTHRSTVGILQSDVAEDLTALRNSRDKISDQIEAIDDQLELLEN